jgi:GNAT superfamily N-acetyltransferase
MSRDTDTFGGPNVETIDRRRICESDARSIAGLLCSIWPRPEWDVETRLADIRRAWREYCGLEAQFPRSFVIRAENRVVAHAEMSPRTIATSAGEITVGALAGVCSDPSVRGQGLGSRLVRAAFKLVDDEVYPFALFQNYEDRRRFYERLGARTIDNRIVNSTAADPRQNPFWADLAMVYPAGYPLPRGEIDLRGNGY